MPNTEQIKLASYDMMQIDAIKLTVPQTTYTHIPALAITAPITHMKLGHDLKLRNNQRVYHDTHRDMPTLPLKARIVLGVEKILKVSQNEYSAIRRAVTPTRYR